MLNVHLLCTQKIAIQIKLLVPATAHWWWHQQRGNIEMEISYQDNHGSADCAARVRFGPLINIYEGLTSAGNLN